jgi:hypothetical protein
MMLCMKEQLRNMRSLFQLVRSDMLYILPRYHCPTLIYTESSYLFRKMRNHRC